MGTLYCLHHDDEPLGGSDPVPCPFCGHGAEDQAPVGSDEIEALGIEDSSAALQHALASSKEPGRSTGMTASRTRDRHW